MTRNRQASIRSNRIQDDELRAKRVETSTGKPNPSRHSRQQHRNELSTSSHTFLTEVGVQHVFKTKERQTISKHNKCKASQLLSLILSCKISIQDICDRHTCAAETPKLQIKLLSNQNFPSEGMWQCAGNILGAPGTQRTHPDPSPILT